MFEKQLKAVRKELKKMTPKQRKLFGLLKFLVIFNLLAIPLHLIMYFNVNLYPLAYLERAQASFFLDIFQVKYLLYDVPYENGDLPAIDINNQVLAIGEACTAIRSLLAFSALVVASPKSWNAKKKALIFLPVIYIVNVIRIVSLAFVSLSFPSLFELIHMLLWREGLVALILGLWVYWFYKSDARPEKSFH